MSHPRWHYEYLRHVAGAGKSPRPGRQGRPGRDGSGDAHAPGDLAGALPERRLACKERVVRRRLDGTIDIDRPRGDAVLPSCGGAPVEGPEGPGELRLLPRGQ